MGAGRGRILYRSSGVGNSAVVAVTGDEEEFLNMMSSLNSNYYSLSDMDMEDVLRQLENFGIRAAGLSVDLSGLSPETLAFLENIDDPSDLGFEIFKKIQEDRNSSIVAELGGLTNAEC